MWLERVGGRAVLGLGDRELSMPAEAHDFLAELLTRAGSVDAADLDGGLDASSTLVVAERLAAEGVVAPG